MHIVRTTVDIPEELFLEAMRLTHLKTKTDVIKEGIASLIRREKLKDLKRYKGSINLGINLDNLRKR
ncbi:type II toxin-antitoxin system VapB family antitoxin [Leptospira kirschneri]|uniref:type II toxin-antitoxin system VapB family antitoxin n=1 Tax=Leptospira kirschneri TaxID=29507 RepID=UPI0002BDAFF1|nr:type II toxin-antitoxin system VapB family antitoxin [Leptospira kirschneri]EMO80443.1 PF09957 family protein [Leptospira kirschneri str. 200801774]UML82327.1 type II toxin-antitoxin system VapB family antitoxin [Leptospira kirschneri]